MSEEEIKDEELNVLFHAAKLGRTDIVQHAVSTLKKKENLSQEQLIETISTPNKDGATALHVAAFNGHSDVVRALLNLGASPTVTLDYGEFSFKSPYEVANHSAIQAFHVYLFEQIAMGHSSIIDDLVSSGIPASLADDSSTADTTLHWAISFNNINAAEMLLSLGVPVDITNNQGKTCLHLACQSSNTTFLKLLLNWGADVTLEDGSGKIAEDYIKEDKKDLKEILNTPVEEVLTSPVKLNNNQKSTNNEDPRLAAEENKLEIEIDHYDEVTKDENNNESTGSYVVLDGSMARGENSNHMSTSANEGILSQGCDVPQDQVNDVVSGSQSHQTPSLVQSSCSSTENSEGMESESHQLILWPPAQRQCQYYKKQPHVVSLDRPLLISCDEDFSHLLNSTRLIGTLNGVGVRTEVQATGKHSGSQLRLSIDLNVCPVRHSFDLHIEHRSMRLIAADDVGLLYAINTFVQILKLHSDYITNPSASGTTNNSFVVNFIKIPCMTIHDCPNIANRGVLWYYPRDIRTKYDHMKDFVVFMSEVRLNQLFLRVDCDDSMEATISPLTSQDEGVGDSEEHQNSLIAAPLDGYELDLKELDCLCQQFCVECVPTIVFTSADQSVPSVITKRQFRCSTVAVAFAFNSDVAERTNAYKSITMTFVQNILHSLLEAEYKSIHLSCSEWMTGEGGEVRQGALEIAADLGLNAVEHPLELFFAELPLCRSFMSTKSYAKPFIEHTKDILDVKKQNALAILPAMAASDFYYPIILLKHMCFLHAGACWNHESLEDILGGFLDDHSMLRPALSTLLFQTYNPNDVEAYNSEEVFQNVMLDIFTASDSDMMSRLTASSSSHSHLHEHCLESPDGKAVRSTVTSEGAIWSLVSATRSSPNMNMPVSKEEAIHVMRRTKRILSAVNWKVVESKKKSVSMSLEESRNRNMNISMIETEEYMRMLNLINTVCRTVVMAYNSAQKPMLPLQTPSSMTQLNLPPSFEEYMAALSPGTSSDLANAILESMTLCGSVWMERFEAKYSTADNDDKNKQKQQASCDDSGSHLVERYIHIQRAELPLLLVFGAICKHMPAFTPDVLMKIFEDGAVAEVVEEPVVSATRSWSLWG